MTAARTAAIALSCLVILGGCRPAVQADTPDAYQVRMTVSPASAGPVQRLSLPAAVYVASQKPDLTDVRIFDASGKRLATALVDDRDISQAPEQTTAVATYPIIGPLNALKLTDVLLRVENGEQARIVGATGRLVPGGAPDAEIGALLDTRGISDPVTAITFDADIPEQQPVTFDLEAGSDLKQWAPLAQKVLFRPAGAAEVLGSGTVLLQSVDLRKRYVRVTWSGAPVSSVRIRRAVVRSSAAPAVQLLDVPTTSPTVIDPHDVRFSLSSGTKLDAIKLTPAAADGVIPVRLFGRNTPEEPWQLVATEVVYGLGVRQDSGQSNLLELGGASYRMYRVEADARISGFSSAPKLDLLYRPASLVVLFRGSRPFTLAAGWSNAPDVFLARKDIVADRNIALSQVPVASVVAAPPTTVILAPSKPNEFSRRSALLWAILGIGAAVLLIATFTLFRKTQSPGFFSPSVGH